MQKMFAATLERFDESGTPCWRPAPVLLLPSGLLAWSLNGERLALDGVAASPTPPTDDEEADAAAAAAASAAQQPRKMCGVASPAVASSCDDRYHRPSGRKYLADCVADDMATAECEDDDGRVG